MFEGCRDLLECEARLNAYLERQQVSLLGELPLSQQDVDWLDTAIGERLGQDPRLGTQFLVRKTPLAFGVYLVWQGIRFYRDGDYWSAVHASTGVADPRYQSIWGTCFLRILRKHKLLTRVTADLRLWGRSFSMAGFPTHVCQSTFARWLGSGL